MIRLATVGTSAITDHFLAACALTGEYIHTAVYSRTAETGGAFAGKHGCRRVFTELLKMAEDQEIDAVYIASPNSLHAAQSRIFLEHGKHVICEKPIVTNSGEYRELKRLADEKGLVYFEAIMSRHAAQRSRVQAALAEIGSIALARIDFCQRSSRYDTYLRGEHVNIFDPSLAAGALMDLGVYCVYAAVDLLGKPEKITASASRLKSGADGGCCAIFTYPGFDVVLSCSKTGQSAIGSEIVGDGGTLKIASVSQYAGVTLVKNGCETVISGFPERAELMSGEAERFAAIINHPAENAAEYADASRLCLTVHECMDAIKQSAELKYQ